MHGEVREVGETYETLGGATWSSLIWAFQEWAVPKSRVRGENSIHVNDMREKKEPRRNESDSSVSEDTDLALVHNAEAFLKFDHKNMKTLKAKPFRLDLTGNREMFHTFWKGGMKLWKIFLKMWSIFKVALKLIGG